MNIVVNVLANANKATEKWQKTENFVNRLHLFLTRQSHISTRHTLTLIHSNMIIKKSAWCLYLHLHLRPPLQDLRGPPNFYAELWTAGLLLPPWGTPQGCSLWTLAGHLAAVGAYVQSHADETCQHSRRWGWMEPSCGQLSPGFFYIFVIEH